MRKNEKEKTNLIDLISGIGIGLCFSIYWIIGILLICISSITALIELSNEKKNEEKSAEKSSKVNK